MKTLKSYCLFLLLVVLASSYNSVNALQEYLLKNDSSLSSVCGQKITSESSFYLNSQVGAGLYGGLNTYDPNEDCEVTFVTDTGFQILVQFLFFNLQEPSGNTCVDKIQLQENVTIAGNGSTVTTYVNVTRTNVTEWCNGTAGFNQTCWNITSNNYTETVAQNLTQPDTYQLNTTVICQNPAPFISLTNSLSIKFVSDGSTQGGGFSILVTAFHTGTCNETQDFLCDTNRCITRNLTCDGINHCLDGLDETKENASCSEIDDDNNDEDSFGGLGKNAVLGIAVVSAGVVCTIIILVIMSQFMDRDSNSCCRGSCQNNSSDEESNTSVTVVGIRKLKTGDDAFAGPSKSLKHKKSVTIAGENETYQKGTGKKRQGIRKVAPTSQQDDEW